MNPQSPEGTLVMERCSLTLNTFDCFDKHGDFLACMHGPRKNMIPVSTEGVWYWGLISPENTGK